MDIFQPCHFPSFPWSWITFLWLKLVFRLIVSPFRVRLQLLSWAGSLADISFCFYHQRFAELCCQLVSHTLVLPFSLIWGRGTGQGMGVGCHQLIWQCSACFSSSNCQGFQVLNISNWRGIWVEEWIGSVVHHASQPPSGKFPLPHSYHELFHDNICLVICS